MSGIFSKYDIIVLISCNMAFDWFSNVWIYMGDQSGAFHIHQNQNTSNYIIWTKNIKRRGRNKSPQPFTNEYFTNIAMKDTPHHRILTTVTHLQQLWVSVKHVNINMNAAQLKQTKNWHERRLNQLKQFQQLTLCQLMIQLHDDCSQLTQVILSTTNSILSSSSIIIFNIDNVVVVVVIISRLAGCGSSVVARRLAVRKATGSFPDPTKRDNDNDNENIY